MKKLAGRFRSLIILGIVFAIWNILAWACVDWKNTKPDLFFYGGYGCIFLAFALVACVLAFYRARKNVPFSVLFPSYIVAAAYLGISFVFNTILMCMPEKDNAKVVFIPNAIIVLLFVAGMVVAHVAISHIGGNNDVIDKKVSTIKRMAIEIGAIAALATDAEVKSGLARLREDVEYSDPMGVADTADIEKEFDKCIAEIRMLVEGNYDTALVLDKISKASNKLVQRNELLRACK